MIKELHYRIFGKSVSLEDSEIAWEAGYWRMRSKMIRISFGKNFRKTPRA